MFSFRRAPFTRTASTWVENHVFQSVSWNGAHGGIRFIKSFVNHRIIRVMKHLPLEWKHSAAICSGKCLIYAVVGLLMLSVY